METVEKLMGTGTRSRPKSKKRLWWEGALRLRHAVSIFLQKRQNKILRFYGDQQTVIFLKGPVSFLQCLMIGSFRCCRQYLREMAHTAGLKRCEARMSVADWTNAQEKGNQLLSLHAACVGL